MSVLPMAAAKAVSQVNDYFVGLFFTMQYQLVGTNTVTADTTTAAPKQCYKPQDDFVDAFRPLFNWAFGNLRGIAPWIVAGVVLFLGIMLVVTAAKREDGSHVMRAILLAVGGLFIILFVPTIMFVVANKAPTC